MCKHEWTTTQVTGNQDSITHVYTRTSTVYCMDCNAVVSQDVIIVDPHEERSAAAAALGRIRTEKKAASSRENGRKGGRPRKS